MAITIREALEAKIGMNTDPKLIDMALIDLGVDGNGVYVGGAELKEQLKEAEIAVLSTMSVLKSFSEGDLSITYDVTAINARLALLRPPVVTETVPKPTITGFNW